MIKKTHLYLRSGTLKYKNQYCHSLYTLLILRSNEQILRLFLLSVNIEKCFIDMGRGGRGKEFLDFYTKMERTKVLW